MMLIIYTHIIITIVIINAVSSLVLLSDLPTPSFIIDVDAFHKRYASILPISADHNAVAPSIRCPDNNLVLHSSINKDICIDCDFKVEEMVPSLGYVHSSVIRAREDKNEDDISTFLAEIDLDHKLCKDALLVLGLNNHHVGGYYWARSAGVGASMEAPGIAFKSSTEGGLLYWKNEGGPTESNSNDGKRSEWCNFLRIGDTVQLVPADGQETLLRFSKHFGKQSIEQKVFGISSKNRPLGSEPSVICEYTFKI